MKRLLHALVADTLYDHQWEHDSCACGWTTADHHNGKSQWTDHCEHVAARVFRDIFGDRLIGRVWMKIAYRRGWVED